MKFDITIIMAAKDQFLNVNLRVAIYGLHVKKSYQHLSAKIRILIYYLKIFRVGIVVGLGMDFLYSGKVEDAFFSKGLFYVAQFIKNG